jgi:hypothetical protein
MAIVRRYSRDRRGFCRASAVSVAAVPPATSCVPDGAAFGPTVTMAVSPAATREPTTALARNQRRNVA